MIYTQSSELSNKSVANRHTHRYSYIVVTIINSATAVLNKNVNAIVLFVLTM